MPIVIAEVPPDCVQIESGLGRAAPLNLVVLPVLFEGEVTAVVELASFHRFSSVHLAFLEQLTESIGIVLDTISATIHAAGEDLLELINEILDLSKIESGNLLMEWTEVSFRTLIPFTERTFRPVADGKGLQFETRLDPQLPRTLRTDTRRLRQVPRNLLANAFKFTERGSVHLEVRAGGTGLGLSICKAIAVSFGGEIQLQSALGQGSTFTLFVPLDPAWADKPAAPRPSASCWTTPGSRRWWRAPAARGWRPCAPAPSTA